MPYDIPRSWADEFDEMLARARARQLPREPRGELDANDAAVLQGTLADELVHARYRARLTQEQVASAMGTTKSVVSRLESRSTHMPSTATLLRYAHAVGCDLEIRLVPRDSE